MHKIIILTALLATAAYSEETPKSDAPLAATAPSEFPVAHNLTFSDPGNTDEEIRDFEKFFGAELPKELKKWLSVTKRSGWENDTEIQVIEKKSGDYEPYSTFKEWGKKHWLVIGGDGSGDFYVIPLKNELGLDAPVFFVDQDSTDKLEYIVASDIEHFVSFNELDALNSRLWPFDKDYVLEHDPDIIKCDAQLLPWNEPVPKDDK